MSDDSLKTLSRSIQVLKAFSPTKSKYTLTELHKKLGLSISSLQRILHTLTIEGFLERDDETKAYSLGLELYFLGNLVESHSRLISTSREEMEKLNKQTNETVTLNIIHQNKRKCIYYIVGQHELTATTFISNESPLHAGASAKVLFAFLPKEKREAMLKDLDLHQITKHTTTNRATLREELDNIRQQKYCVSESERVLGVYSISSPIRDRLGNILASVSLTIPLVRVNKDHEENYIRLVLNCANSISESLGFSEKF